MIIHCCAIFIIITQEKTTLLGKTVEYTSKQRPLVSTDHYLMYPKWPLLIGFPMIDLAGKQNYQAEQMMKSSHHAGCFLLNLIEKRILALNTQI